MNYIGSKLSIIEFIDETIIGVLEDNKEDLDNIIFADLFAGTGIVGKHFKEKGFEIISNDIQYYSYILNKSIIENNNILEFKGLEKEIPELGKDQLEKRLDYVLKYLENIDLEEGFIYNNYSLGGTKGEEYERQYFSDYNARKCDSIRLKINEWYGEGLLGEKEYYTLLAALVYSIDKYANTASVYGAFLKKIKKTADRKLKLKQYENIYDNKKINKVYNEDVNDLIKNIEGDVLYLDPPYNERQYNANYHLLETIAKYDKPTIRGKTGLRNERGKKSEFCSRLRAINAMERLVRNSEFKYIFLSYNNEGIIPLSEIERIFKIRGEYQIFRHEHKRFIANNRKQKMDNTIEYIHCCVVK